jgi:SWIM zinc finger/Reverse transcriptase-like
MIDDGLGASTMGGEWFLEVAAVREGTTHVAGIGWRLRGPDGPLPVEARTLRVGRTLAYAQLAAVRSGLLDAQRVGSRRLVVRVPERLVARLLRGERIPRARRAAASATKVRMLFSSFEAVRIEVASSVDPELHHAVGEALDVGLHAVAEREEQRELVMERILDRAKEVHLESRNGEWVANGRYRVSLDPIRCECPAWTARWAGAPIAGRRAQRLLCKHLVALALLQGIREPSDLAALARRAAP